MKSYISEQNQFSFVGDIETTKLNLHISDERQTRMLDARQALLQEFIETILSCGDDEFDAMRSIQDIFNDVDRLSAKGDESNRYLSNISLLDKVYICDLLSKKNSLHRDLCEFLNGADEICNEEAVGKIAYMRNNFTDIAYRHFSKIISHSSPLYHTSFQSVCEEVEAGGCEYCILPIENSSDGKLMSFYTMMNKYELKICYVCTVKHSNERDFTKFALLSKSLDVSGILSTSPSYLNKSRLEIRVTQTSETDNPLCNILNAASACSLGVQRIDSLSLSYNEDLLGYYIIFIINNADIKPFLTFLALEFPQSYVVGVYSSVN